MATSPAEPGTVNVDVELFAANAKYRVGQPRMKDRQTAVEVLDEASEAYRGVLEHSVRNPRAAYNYEFVSRLKQEVGKGEEGDVVEGRNSTGAGLLDGQMAVGAADLDEQDATLFRIL